MIFSLGFLGLILTFYFFRKPNVKFFSFITFFNRKEKLTDAGAKLYVIFCIVIIAGLLIGKSSKGTEPVNGSGIKEQSSSMISDTEGAKPNYKNMGVRDASYAALSELKARYAGTHSEQLITDCSSLITEAEIEKNLDVVGLRWRNARDYCVSFAKS
jgi:hypothetical protein